MLRFTEFQLCLCVCVEVGHCVLFTFTQDFPSKTEQGAERRKTGKPPPKKDKAS